MLFDEDWMTDEDVDIILRETHLGAESGLCTECGFIWPCATIKALDHVKAYLKEVTR